MTATAGRTPRSAETGPGPDRALQDVQSHEIGDSSIVKQVTVPPQVLHIHGRASSSLYTD